MSPEHGPRDDLVRFVQDSMREQSLSLRRMSVRAIDPQTGQRLGFQWLGKLTAGGLSKAPDPWQLRALAAALGVHEGVIKDLAARQWLEYEIAQVALGPSEWALYLQVKHLPEAEQKRVRLLVQTFVRSQEQVKEGDGTGDARA